jgi:capsular polysaccharide biosynthesis protein
VKLRDYRRILRRRGWIPFSLTVAAVVAVGLANLSSGPGYVATATVLAKVGPFAGQKSLGFDEVATSESVASRVRDRLHLTDPPQKLAQRVSVKGDLTALYRVSVTAHSAADSVRIANAVSEEAASTFTRLVRGISQNSIQLDTQGALYRARFLAASKRLLEFVERHPDFGAELDLQNDALFRDSTARTDAPINLRPVGTTGDASDGATFRALLLEERIAADEYQNFEAKPQMPEAEQARDLGGAQVVDTAVAESDTRARLLRLLYAATLAVVVGTGIAFLLEHLCNSIDLPEQVEELTGRPVIAIIPRVSEWTGEVRGARGG